MTSSLEQENRSLRRQLKAFVSQARENEEKLRRFNEQELKLIGTTSVPELIDMVLQQYPQAFNLDCISLLLLDPEYELARMLEDTGRPIQTIPGLLIETSPQALQAALPYAPQPNLGAYCENALGHLFPFPSKSLCSCAVLPLLRRGELIGSLNMGSCKEERFLPGSGTEFLERLAAIIAICLENCANRQRLKQIGLTDPLTRIHNRRYFDQRLGEEVAAGERNRQPLSCMFIDVDHFKRINDTLGHQSGDAVLRELAKRINDQLRHCDVLSRYGGEEFVVLLPNTNARDCYEIAERIRSSIEQQPFRLHHQPPLQLTISIGISHLEHSTGSTDIASQASALISSADQALYRAKQEGRNRVAIQSVSYADAG